MRVMYTRKGISDTVVYDEAGISERYGVPARSYPLLAALRGDVSDNLPGVPGVGEKTAAKLITTYGDLDGIFEHAAELSPKLRQSLLDHEAQVRANAAVIPLVRDVPLQVGVDDLGLGRWDAEKVKGVFAELELRSLWQRLAPIVGGGEEKLPRSSTAPPGLEVDLTGVEVVSPGGSKAASDALRRVAGQGVAVALYPSWVGDPGRSKLTGLAVAAVPDPASAKDGASPELSALWLDEEAVADEAVLRALGALVGQGGAGVMAHGAKELMRSLLPLGADVTGLDMDTAVAALPSRSLLGSLQARGSARRPFGACTWRRRAGSCRSARPGYDRERRELRGLRGKVRWRWACSWAPYARLFDQQGSSVSTTRWNGPWCVSSHAWR